MDKMSLNELEPKAVWQHFDAINAIPRASNKEAQLINYMVAFGKALNLETSVDATGNVIIKKPATQGKENCRIVTLQGHLDMVHQKEATSNFNFDTEGIQMYVEGDWVKAHETTLGADNGIGVAAIMAILSSTDIEHPPIEGLFTVDEEKGMTGAMALTNNQLQGELLLNLDSEDDDEITIGCAGGVDVTISEKYDVETIDTKAHKQYKIIIDGLSGGHSGVDIHLNRANAIIVLTECLAKLAAPLNCRLHSLHSGTLTNVIPRNGCAIIAVPKDKLVAFPKTLEAITKQLKHKYHTTDPELRIEAVVSEELTKVMDVESQKKLFSSILKIPNGVFAMTKGVEGLVQSSNNISIINVERGASHIACHTRSSVDAERDALVHLLRDCFSFAKVVEIGPYPGWEPKPESNLLAIAKRCYEDLNGMLPAINSIHAGLECGILSATFPHMEMISFGPNIRGAHSPEERLQISSVQKFWKFLNRILQTIE